MELFWNNLMFFINIKIVLTFWPITIQLFPILKLQININ